MTNSANDSTTHDDDNVRSNTMSAADWARLSPSYRRLLLTIPAEDIANCTRHRSLQLLQSWAGSRIEELRALRPDDVHSTGGSMVVRRPKSNEGDGPGL